MGEILSFFTNRLCLAVICAWVLAQGIKVIISLAKRGKPQWHRFVEPGGMPSSHAAVVIALLTGVGILRGIHSTIFIVTLIFSLAIIYEAVGVRKEVEQQAEILSSLIEKLPSKNKFKINLKKSLGHRPIDVAVGGIVGLIIALIWMR
ncbi:divergent PAP2 family protein [Candidatus Aerophobetes bacterium]|nr:divergent PAP2 family protein [Candidatus Aerophobetes bacterium]